MLRRFMTNIEMLKKYFSGEFEDYSEWKIHSGSKIKAEKDKICEEFSFLNESGIQHIAIESRLVSTKERINRLLKHLVSKNIELTALNGKSGRTLWEDDLIQVEEMLNQLEEQERLKVIAAEAMYCDDRYFPFPRGTKVVITDAVLKKFKEIFRKKDLKRKRQIDGIPSFSKRIMTTGIGPE